MVNSNKCNIISGLKKELLFLQGLKTAHSNNPAIGFQAIEKSFPHQTFPTGCIHEFICNTPFDIAATNGFVAAIAGKLTQIGGVLAWISASRTLFPAALKYFQVDPHQVIFIDLHNEKEVLYATEEALKCNRFTAVLSEIKHLDFTISRRFQLATEKSRGTGFILRHQPRVVNTIACVARWHISSLPSETEEDLPGVGFCRWRVELVKVRNGQPGCWEVEWSANRFKEIQTAVAASAAIIRKIG